MRAGRARAGRAPPAFDRPLDVTTGVGSSSDREHRSASPLLWVLVILVAIVGGVLYWRARGPAGPRSRWLPLPRRARRPQTKRWAEEPPELRRSRPPRPGRRPRRRCPLRRSRQRIAFRPRSPRGRRRRPSRPARADPAPAKAARRPHPPGPRRLRRGRIRRARTASSTAAPRTRKHWLDRAARDAEAPRRRPQDALRDPARAGLRGRVARGGLVQHDRPAGTMWVLTTSFRGEDMLPRALGPLPDARGGGAGAASVPGVLFDAAQPSRSYGRPLRAPVSATLRPPPHRPMSTQRGTGRVSRLPVRDAAAAGPAADLPGGAEGDALARPRRRDPAPLLREGRAADGDLLPGRAAHRRLPQAPRLDHRHRPELGPRHRGQAGPRAARQDPGRARARLADGPRRRDAPARRGDRLLDLRLGHGRVQVPGLRRRARSRRRPDALDGGDHRRGDPPPARERSVPRAPGRRAPRPDARDRSDVALPVPSADAAGGLPALARSTASSTSIPCSRSRARRAPPRPRSSTPWSPAASSSGSRKAPSVPRAAGAASTGSTSRSSAQPSDRSPGHAELVKNTYRRIDWLTHYELLGDPARRAAREESPRPTSSAAACSTRTCATARTSRKFEKELDGGLRADEERVRDALGCREAGALRPEPGRGPASPSCSTADGRSRGAQEARDAELPARAPAHRGKDYHPAVEMLREAVRFVPDNAEFRYVLSQVELKNPNWIDQGLANLKEAARLDSRRVGLSAGGRARAARAQAPARGRAVRPPRGLARSVARERGAAPAGPRRRGRGAAAADAELEPRRDRRRRPTSRAGAGAHDRRGSSPASSGTAVDRDPDGPRPRRPPRASTPGRSCCSSTASSCCCRRSFPGPTAAFLSSHVVLTASARAVPRRVRGRQDPHRRPPLEPGPDAAAPGRRRSARCSPRSPRRPRPPGASASRSRARARRSPRTSPSRRRG